MDLQGTCILEAMVSRLIFRKLVKFSLQMGHLFTCDLQLLQMLWPSVHIVIGGSIYSRQTGHFSSGKKLCESSFILCFEFYLATWGK